MTSLRGALKQVRKQSGKALKPIVNKYNKLRGFTQFTSVTRLDRYPEIFLAVQKLTPPSESPRRILSYGCSTGEECITLGQYFPGSEIIGIDISLRNLFLCHMRNPDRKRLRFLYSSKQSIADNGPYDIIFAMSVLCRWPESKSLENCGKLYAFKAFESDIGTLNQALRPGGLLVIYNSNFRLADTHLSSNFEIISSPDIPDSGFVNKFGPDNRRITSPDDASVIFRKKPFDS